MNLTTQDGAGGLLPQRRGPPGARRPLRHRGGGPRAAEAPAGQNVVPFHVSATRWAFDMYDVATQAMSSNYVEVADGRGSYSADPLPLRLARRARPDGPARRDAAARPVGRLDAGAVHEREPPARLGLGEAGRPDRPGGRTPRPGRSRPYQPVRSPVASATNAGGAPDATVSSAGTCPRCQVTRCALPSWSRHRGCRRPWSGGAPGVCASSGVRTPTGTPAPSPGPAPPASAPRPCSPR